MRSLILIALLVGAPPAPRKPAAKKLAPARPAARKPAPTPGIPRAALAFPPLPAVERLERAALDGAMTEVLASGRARIEYGHGVARAIGFGALPPPTLARSRAQDTLHAREGALADALRTLGMAVQKVRVDADTRVSNYVLASDEVRVLVAAAVRGAEVVDETFFGSLGIYRVVVQTPLTGAGSVAEAVGSARAPASGTPGGPPPDGAVFTGLLIDCRGLRLIPARTPRVFDTDRDEVYGTDDRVSSEFLDDHGMAAYPRAASTARGEGTRVGERPLVVRAVGVRDARTFPVISAADARRVREANRRDRFLERAAVAFLIDP